MEGERYREKEGTHFIVADRNRFVNIIPNRSDFSISLGFFLDSKLFCIFLGLFQFGLLLNQIIRIFFVLS